MKMEKLLSQYFRRDLTGRIIKVNRAFLGIYAILSALKKKKTGTKVLYSTTTCASPVYASSYAGLTPVFADISKSDFLMDEADTFSLIEKYKDDLLAVVYIYIYGHTSTSIFKIREKCKQYGIYLIEDLAQAFGSSVDGTPTGILGDFSVMSFGHTKQIDVKRGGIIINNALQKISNEEIMSELDGIDLVTPLQELSGQYGASFYVNRRKALANDEDFSLYSDFINIYKNLYFSYAPVNWELIEEKLKDYLDKGITEQRNTIARKYKEGLSKLSDRIYCPDIRDSYSEYRYTIVLKDNTNLEEFSEYLRQNGVNCSNLYIPINRFYGEKGCPNALSFAQRCVNLWVDPLIATDEYIENTIKQITSYYEK